MRRRAERLSSSDSEGEGYAVSYATGSPQMFEMSESEDSNDATVYYSPTAASPPSAPAQVTSMTMNGKGKLPHVLLRELSRVLWLSYGQSGKFLSSLKLLGIGRA